MTQCSSSHFKELLPTFEGHRSSLSDRRFWGRSLPRQGHLTQERGQWWRNRKFRSWETLFRKHAPLYLRALKLHNLSPVSIDSGCPVSSSKKLRSPSLNDRRILTSDRCEYHCYDARKSGATSDRDCEEAEKWLAAVRGSLSDWTWLNLRSGISGLDFGRSMVDASSRSAEMCSVMVGSLQPSLRDRHCLSARKGSKALH